MQKTFFGKYRGKVEDNKDPKKLGRLQVSVPLVLGDISTSWAMPCVPYAGDNVGLLLLPPEGANVWVEFEGGNPDYPIWTGCYWNNGKLPEGAGDPLKKVLKTESFTLLCDDTDNKGSLKFEIGKPAVKQPLTITLDKNGISLVNAQAAVKISEKGLEITYKQAIIKLSDADLQIKQKQQKVVLNSSAVTIT